jgi:hypothetical protein
VRKVFILVGLVAALAIPATAAAAILHAPHQNAVTCSEGGLFHFVQNQTGGSQVNNTLTAQFTGGNVVMVQDKVTPGGTYHWTILDSPSGTLITASTSVAAGNLVLSNYECDAKKPKK